MTNLTMLLQEVPVLESQGNTDVQIREIQYDSRKVSPGDVFVAIRGEAIDGHAFIDAAIEQGARAVVVEVMQTGLSVPCFRVGNSRKTLALMSSSFYGNPGTSMEIIGITGTNGKTSTAYLIESILQAGGYRTGMIGTISYSIGTERRNALWTTPESLELQQFLSAMRKQKTEAVIMEVSSHALAQYRVEGLIFRLALFTNLSQDHLDYHRSMEHYTTAKQRLFRQIDSIKGENIINGDDPVNRSMAQQNRRPVFTFSLHAGKADVFPVSAEFLSNGITATLHTPGGDIDVTSTLVGQHNLYNIMGAVCAGMRFGISHEKIQQGVSSLKQVPGRLEPVHAGQRFPVLVDYAHTHDAMEKVIKAVRLLVKGSLIVVFGCGGDRDRGKRPLMGRIAEQGADRAILTSDNPRTEDPKRIINDVLEGITDRSSVEVFIDRAEAIHRAIDIAEEQDWVLILGKGHETYQVLGTKRIAYDDREVARAYLRKKFNRSHGNQKKN